MMYKQRIEQKTVSQSSIEKLLTYDLNNSSKNNFDSKILSMHT